MSEKTPHPLSILDRVLTPYLSAVGEIVPNDLVTIILPSAETRTVDTLSITQRLDPLPPLIIVERNPSKDAPRQWKA